MQNTTKDRRLFLSMLSLKHHNINITGKVQYCTDPKKLPCVSRLQKLHKFGAISTVSLCCSNVITCNFVNILFNSSLILFFLQQTVVKEVQQK